MLFPTTTALNSKAKIILTLSEGLLSMQKAVLSSARIWVNTKPSSMFRG